MSSKISSHSVSKLEEDTLVLITLFLAPNSTNYCCYKQNEMVFNTELNEMWPTPLDIYGTHSK